VQDEATALAEGIRAALPAWVVGCVTTVMTAWAGSLPAEVAASAEEAGQKAGEEVGRSLADLLSLDIDEQWTTPLALVRRAVSYPTAVLQAAGVPAVERDPFAEHAFPDDIYALSPASLSDLAPDLVELGIAWGAAKAWHHRRRHGGA
jgi:hypothetical protein